VEQSTNGACWANPTLVADPSTGRVTLFYALNDANDASRVFFRGSRDDGWTWSARTEVTGLFADDPAGRPFHLPGPGHGIALRDGRLVVQVWHRQSVDHPAEQRQYGASVLVSDDHGVTWQAGGRIPVDPVHPVNEARLFERADGALVLDGRYSSGGVHPRIRAVSTDRGRSWAPPVFDTAVRSYTAVDSGLVRLTGGHGRPGASRLLFSRPDSTTARENMTVAVSYDEGRSFPYERVVYAGVSTYSDLAHLPDGTALLLYGRDTSTGHPVDHVALARFDIAWLTGGRDSVRTGPAWHQQRFDAATLPVLRRRSLRTTRVADPYTASGHGLLLRASTPGARADFRLDVERPGRYELVLRCNVSPTTPPLSVAVDGEAVGPAVATALADGTGYTELSCGVHRFAGPGPHTLSLTVAPVGGGAGARAAPGGTSAGLDIELDYVALRA
jgi:sialidase-1